MRTEKPTVSVCIPVFNPENHLCSAIQSVLDQDYLDYELLVVDDGSKETPESVVKEFADPRIRFIRNEVNAGLPANWNRCIELSLGAYIALLHQDDVMRPGSLRKKVAMLELDASVGFVYSDIVAIDEKGVVIGGHHIAQPNSRLVLDGCDFYRMVAETGNPVACSSVIVRRNCYERLGGFDTSLPFATDLEMWLRIAAAYRVGFVAEKLTAQRNHAGQETRHFEKSGRDYLDVKRAFDRIPFNSIPSACARSLISCYVTLARQAIPMARWQLSEGNFRAGSLYVLVAILAIFKSLSYRAAWHLGVDENGA